jgi:hypothetical protein
MRLYISLFNQTFYSLALSKAYAYMSFLNLIQSNFLLLGVVFAGMLERCHPRLEVQPVFLVQVFNGQR